MRSRAEEGLLYGVKILTRPPARALRWVRRCRNGSVNGRRTAWTPPGTGSTCTSCLLGGSSFASRSGAASKKSRESPSISSPAEPASRSTGLGTDNEESFHAPIVSALGLVPLLCACQTAQQIADSAWGFEPQTPNHVVPPCLSKRLTNLNFGSASLALTGTGILDQNGNF
jgi:hypothetical protein